MPVCCILARAVMDCQTHLQDHSWRSWPLLQAAGGVGDHDDDKGCSGGGRAHVYCNNVTAGRSDTWGAVGVGSVTAR